MNHTSTEETMSWNRNGDINVHFHMINWLDIFRLLKFCKILGWSVMECDVQTSAVLKRVCKMSE